MTHESDADGGFADVARAINPTRSFAVASGVPVISVRIHPAFGVAHHSACFNIEEIVHADATKGVTVFFQHSCSVDGNEF